MGPAMDWQMIGIGALAVVVTAILLFVALLVSRGLVKRQSFNTLILLLLAIGAVALAMAAAKALLSLRATISAIDSCALFSRRRSIGVMLMAASREQVASA
jgi:hypothetical protein